MATPTPLFEYESGRIAAELEVARGLVSANPARAGRWNPLIARAEAAVQGPLAREDAPGLRKAVREAEGILAPLAGTAKELTVHLVGHAHMDMNWMWSWTETVALVSDTLRTACLLMRDYPAFKLSQSQASIYRILEEHDPELLAQVRELVRAGRWEVTASHWVECDKNMTGGESLCRHILNAKRYIHDLVGVSPDDLDVDWSPDTFGHAATVPVYLAHGGVKYLYLHRPGFLGSRRPNVFWWRGPDGSRVLAYNDIKRGYNGVVTPALGRFALEFQSDTGARDMLFVYGVGDHGGGPTRADIERGIDLDTWPVFPTVRFSTARACFRVLAAQGAKLPVFEGELNTEFSGCYTSESLIKKANRNSENRLFDAEAAAAFAWRAAKRAYPGEGLTRAWRDTLFSHFHDILPGSGVHDTRTRAHGMYQETMATTMMAETLSLRALSNLTDTSGPKAGSPAPDALPGSGTSGRGFAPGWWAHDGKLSTIDLANDGLVRPFVVWNHTNEDREDVVEAVLWLRPQSANTAWEVRGPDGRVIPVQVVKTANEWWYYEYFVLAFPVRVPAFGYAVYTVSPAKAGAKAPGGTSLLEPRHPTAYCTVERPAIGLENSLVRVEMDPATGAIASLRDKRTGTEMIAAPGAGLEFGIERPHGMTSWTVAHTGGWERPRLLSLGGKEEGPYRASVDAELAFGESRFTLHWRLFEGDPTVYADLEGTWFERGTPEKGVPVLRFTAPLKIANAAASYEIALGAIDRPYHSNEEVPALSWAAVTGKAGNGKPAGLVLANDCKHGHALDGNTMNLTLIRASYDPDPLPEIGRHEMRFSLTPVSGKPSAAEATRLARRLNHPLRPIPTGIHAGALGKAGSLVSVEGPGLLVSAIKKSEDGDDLIVRIYETLGKSATATIRPHKALGIPKDACEVDLLERRLKSSSASVKSGAVRVKVPSRGLVSVRVTFAKS